MISADICRPHKSEVNELLSVCMYVGSDWWYGKRGNQTYALLRKLLLKWWCFSTERSDRFWLLRMPWPLPCLCRTRGVRQQDGARGPGQVGGPQGRGRAHHRQRLRRAEVSPAAGAAGMAHRRNFCLEIRLDRVTECRDADVKIRQFAFLILLQQMATVLCLLSLY